ncbi:unnamed protein product [Strongylus vulgaris]|uniref:MARVEL domain-containing protein n=1 Tax=Strongylus vulgaris TaxID=40348 RepID=A0A3P7JH92_STRVU|nr:unnamed protein product [Strongylus vulgaris]
MPLYVSRFTEFPYFFKVLTVFFSLTTLISLTGASLLPGGSSLIWFSVILALVIDLVLIAILLFELERIELPFSCFANFVLYAANFAVYLRKWMAEQRAARSDPSGVYDFPSYGSP